MGTKNLIGYNRVFYLRYMSVNGSKSSSEIWTVNSSLLDVGTKWAVLVGINEYFDTSFSDLNYSVNDIKGLYEILIDPDRGQYNRENIYVLSDEDDINPTRNHIISRLSAISRSATSDDSILFYFSGHGHVDEDQSYLLSADSFRNSLKDTAISTELIKKIMGESLARVKIIILDSCHSGAIKGIKNSGIMTKSFFDSIFPPPEGFVVLSSCKLNEFSYEWPEKDHSVFSYYLLEGLRGSADKDEDGTITITDTHSYTSDKVKKWAFQKGIEQSPTLDAKISGDIPFIYSIGFVEIEEAVDKSIISDITLISEYFNDMNVRDSKVQEICGTLLRFYNPDQIIKSNKYIYDFPYGKIYLTWELLSKYGINVVFIYRKENWDSQDKIISILDLYFNWIKIKYSLNKKINISNIVKKCRESDFNILAYEPGKDEQMLKVESEGWADTITIFKNLEETSEIHINPSKSEYLKNNFYEILNAENIIKFI